MRSDDEAELEVETGRGLRVRRPIQCYKEFALTSKIPFQIPSVPDVGLSDDEPPDTPAVEVQPANTAPVQPATQDEILRSSILDQRSWRSTPRNVFGLYKKFWAPESSPHDPNCYISGEDLQDVTHAEEFFETADLFPFPNLNAFLLGEWYWRDGNEKSHESFRDLVNIITHEGFDPEDIRAANWDWINMALASSEFEGHADSALQWLGDGSSWHSTPVLINVPCNSTSLKPGVHQYEVPGFRYRPLVPILIERLKDMSKGEHFTLSQPIFDGNPRMEDRICGSMGRCTIPQRFWRRIRKYRPVYLVSLRPTAADGSLSGSPS